MAPACLLRRRQCQPQLALRVRTPSLKVVFANRAHNCCLRSLVPESLGKSHFLPDLVEFAVGHAVAMKIDLAPVGRRNEFVIALWYEQTDDAVRGIL